MMGVSSLSVNSPEMRKVHPSLLFLAELGKKKTPHLLLKFSSCDVMMGNPTSVVIFSGETRCPSARYLLDPLRKTCNHLVHFGRVQRCNSVFVLEGPANRGLNVLEFLVESCNHVRLLHQSPARTYKMQTGV